MPVLRLAEVQESIRGLLLQVSECRLDGGTERLDSTVVQNDTERLDEELHDLLDHGADGALATSNGGVLELVEGEVVAFVVVDGGLERVPVEPAFVLFEFDVGSGVLHHLRAG